MTDDTSSRRGLTIMIVLLLCGGDKRTQKKDIERAKNYYVLHAFQKKGRKTPKVEIELARKRYRAMLNERKL